MLQQTCSTTFIVKNVNEKLTKNQTHDRGVQLQIAKSNTIVH
jgi:hypothetical protein